MAHCGAMLQVGPHLCAPTVQSSIWLWQELRWRKRWRGQQRLRKRLIGWLPHLGTPPWNLSSLHLLPPLLPFFSRCLPRRRPTGLSGPMQENKAQPAPPGHYQPHTCCLFPMPTIFLCSNACLFKDPHSTMTNGDISFLIFGSVCTWVWGKFKSFFPFQTVCVFSMGS